MALTVKQLNGDTSFLLTLEPIGPCPGGEPFRILLDPWFPGPELVIEHDETYSKSYHEYEEPLRIATVRELPEPDLVIISKDRSDHCNKATLKQLPRTNTKTVILAEPAAAKQIRSWKYFDKEMVISLQKWEDPRAAGRETTTRVPVPPQHPGGDPGEVTISFITQKKDRWRVHTAVGITYRPPPSRPLTFYRPLLTPPVTPKPPPFRMGPRLPSPPPLSPMILHFKHKPDIPPFPFPLPPTGHHQKRASYDTAMYPSAFPLPGTAFHKRGGSYDAAMSPSEFRFPTPPNVLHKKRASYDLAMTLSPFPPRPTPPPRPPSPSPPDSPRLRRIRSNRSIISVSPHARDRSISIIFSPHGITYQSLETYATTHLVAEAALPLTALLHCFDAVAGPWWLPGSINSGMPDGQKIATALGAKAWVSAHDARRNTRHGWAGRMAGRMARTRRYRQSEVRRELDQAAWDSNKKAPHTEIMSLGVGEDVALTSEGVWEPDTPVRPRVMSMIF
ncbi:hypothetical protein G7Z17_g11351 [Cylindrodendrum hubeiense]|uniref:Uncharacterized protein n=1 Tax=Cylindrodendrum hubeiense TaxID=595255 RepID=A0A9P5H446_9HYPO|nr:hypothetical protein G7Z17_g11351 [Cylindrodendrum hubeiense]